MSTIGRECSSVRAATKPHPQSAADLTQKGPPCGQPVIGEGTVPEESHVKVGDLQVGSVPVEGESASAEASEAPERIQVDPGSFEATRGGRETARRESTQSEH